MNGNEMTSGDLSSISPGVLVKYLTARGWILLEPSKATDIAILRKTVDGQTDEIIVPRDQEFADYFQGITEVIRRISLYEKRSMEGVLRDLLTSHSDVLRIRITGKNVEAGSIPLLDERAIMDGFKKVLMASACYIIDPKSFYPKLQRSEAEQLLQNCRLGTSEAGSYIINVQIPLYDAEYSQNEGTDKPFPRKVAEYLMKSLNRVVTYVEEQNIAHTVNIDAFELNANLCLGLVELVLCESKTHLDFQMSWSNDVPVAADIPAKVTIYDNYIPSIAKLAHSLKPVKEVTQNTFIGKIKSLNGVENENGQMEGDVTFSLLVDEESLTAKGFLTSQFYRDACDAHKDGKYIKISAILREKTRTSDLDQISLFEVLPK